MKVGFTYDMREDYLAHGYAVADTGEMDSKDTIDKIAAALESCSLEIDRIGNVRALIKRLAAGDRWDFVFNICEGVHGPGREAQVPALLEACGVPFVFSSSWTMMVTLDKALTKTVLHHAGVPTAAWRVVRDGDDVSAIDLLYPLFAKPMAEGSSLGVSERSRAHNAAELQTVCAELLARHRQPVLVEPFLPGREFTVGIIGTGPDARVIGVMEARLETQGQHVFSRSFAEKQTDHENPAFRRLCDDETAREAGRIALQAWRVLDCRDAGRIDIRCDAAGKPHVLEINALAGLSPGYSDLCTMAELAGMDYHTLIGEVIAAFLARCALTPAAAKQRAAS